eukprot:CAMPEP_0172512738 /NCGR_PEP_ID=MMETSP1066-20121228/246817_1 /TAXON_ID=671091 /ORGANISM="Coscinodiscus wailesii, Strain CCMP2513" /LENGTH=626 /DNA_ID=CAMNT_0013292675 /DNA_START=603 /DNA_END=2483 /DNA_ORIENTATION=+
MDADDPVTAAAARKIYPIRCNGNLLLCTLLLGNVAVNALLSILMADMTSGLVGFITSTVVIVIFGEIVPQAACSRYALKIGSKSIPVVRVIIMLLYPIAKPLAFALDKILGRELGMIYTKSEMRKLLEITVERGGMDAETGFVMEGALKYKDVTVKEVMTPLGSTFMLNVDEKLNFETVSRIFKTGYSRIPVYEVSMNNIIGLLFVKDLIFIDPEDGTPVRSFVQIFGRGVHVVWPDDKLGDVLRELKQGKSHMAIVRDVNNEDTEQDPFYEIKGIITLEDIIEVILGDEIVDETDAFIDVTQSLRVNRDTFDWGRLRLLDANITDRRLSDDEVAAITAHLKINYTDAVQLLTDTQLKKLLASTTVTEYPTAKQEVGEDLPRDLLYASGQPTDSTTIILSGKVTVLAGKDKFRSDASSWSVLAPNALIDSSYTPDFTAYVSDGPCRCISITRDQFTLAVDASVSEKLNSNLSERPTPELKTEKSSLGDDSEHSAVNKKSARSKRVHRGKLLEVFQKKSVATPVTNEVELTDTKQKNEENGTRPKEPIPRTCKNTTKRMSQLQIQLTDGGSYLPRPRYSTENEKKNDHNDIHDTTTKSSSPTTMEFIDCTHYESELGPPIDQVKEEV